MFVFSIELALLLLGLVLTFIGEVIDRRRSRLVSAAGGAFVGVGFVLVVLGGL